jgi:hypothetical protein
MIALNLESKTKIAIKKIENHFLLLSFFNLQFDNCLKNEQRNWNGGFLFTKLGLSRFN